MLLSSCGKGKLSTSSALAKHCVLPRTNWTAKTSTPLTLLSILKPLSTPSPENSFYTATASHNCGWLLFTKIILVFFCFRNGYAAAHGLYGCLAPLKMFRTMLQFPGFCGIPCKQTFYLFYTSPPCVWT